jgi:hypothetical protein
MPWIISDYLLAEDNLSLVQESLLYYSFWINLFTLSYTGDAPNGDRISMVWSTFVLFRLISSAPRSNMFTIG